MTTQMILVIAIVVFVLMVIGLVLTMIEFRKMTGDQSRQKGASRLDYPDTA